MADKILIKSEVDSKEDDHDSYSEADTVTCESELVGRSSSSFDEPKVKINWRNSSDPDPDQLNPITESQVMAANTFTYFPFKEIGIGDWYMTAKIPQPHQDQALTWKTLVSTPFIFLQGRVIWVTPLQHLCGTAGPAGHNVQTYTVNSGTTQIDQDGMQFTFKEHNGYAMYRLNLLTMESANTLQHVLINLRCPPISAQQQQGQQHQMWV